MALITSWKLKLMKMLQSTSGGSVYDCWVTSTQVGVGVGGVVVGEIVVATESVSTVPFVTMGCRCGRRCRSREHF